MDTVLEIIADMGYLLLMVILEGLSCIIRSVAFVTGFIVGTVQAAKAKAKLREQRQLEKENAKWERNHDLK